MPDLNLDIYGNGEEEQNLIKKFAGYDNINFYDAVPNERLPEVMSRYCYGLLLSKYEGMPKVAIEMMAMGLILVATPVGNLPQIINHGKNAFLVPTEQSCWCNLFQKLLTYQEYELETIRSSAAETIEKFSVENAILRELSAWENT